MKIKKIDHLGIIVENLEESIVLFEKGLNLQYLRTEEIPDWNCRIAFFQCGEVLLELVEPTGDSEGKDFLQTRGGGLHHIAFEVEDIAQAFMQAQTSFKTKADAPAVGAGDSKVFFLDEKTILNISTELVELKKEK